MLTLLRADGWDALSTLFHDGEPWDVELSAPVRLTAHVVDADGHDITGASVRIRFDAVAGLPEDASFWNCAPMTTDAFSSPARAPSSPGARWSIRRLVRDGARTQLVLR